MSSLSEIRTARTYLAHVCRPFAPHVAELVGRVGPVAAAKQVRAGQLPDPLAAELIPDHERIQTRPTDFGDPALGRDSWRLIVPEQTEEWPAQLLLRRATDSAARSVLAQPFALWVRGSTRLPQLLKKAVSVVGARHASSHATDVATLIGKDLAANGITTISGAAFGCDVAAHGGALDAGGSTIAVLPCGVDVAYPAAHRPLLDAIARCGAIVSAYPPGTLPERPRFLARNTIVAALSPVTVVVEAGHRGSTLATAQYAHRLNRTVLAVPGEITSPQCAGSNSLLRDGTASMVTSVSDVLAHFQAIAAPASATTPDPAPSLTAR